MEVKILALRALKEIIDEKNSFQIVLERILNEYNLSNEDKKLLRLDVLGSIRHFYFLRYEITTAFPEFESDADEIYLLILALHEIRYHSKKIALYQTIESTATASEYLSLRLTASDISAKLTFLSTHKTKIPDDLKKDPYAYNSLFFSMPSWLIRMWADQYGDEQTMNILLTSQRRAPQWLAINQSAAERDSYSADPRFTLSTEVAGGLMYNCPGPCSEIPEVRQGNLFVQDLSLQYLLERLDYPYQAKSLHIGAVTGGVAANLGLKLQGKNGSVEAIFADEKRYRRGKYLLQRIGVKNCQCYLGSLKMLKTYAPYGEHDLVVVTPPNSYLGQIRKRPDIPLTLKKEDLQTVIALEREYLREASLFVAPDGVLVYAVQTMNLREGDQLIKEFLEETSAFVLMKSRQIFPIDFNADGLYFAVLKRVGS